MERIKAANLMAGTVGRGEQGALNILAGSKGLDILGVLNRLCGTDGVGYGGCWDRLGGPDGFTAPILPGNLEAWYDARFPNGFGGGLPADGDAVAQWNDLSGNDRHVVQAAEATKPLFRSANRNLLTYNQATVETDTAGLTGLNDTTIARVTSQALHGTASLQATKAVADGHVQVATGFILGISAGATYTAVASFKSAVTSRTCYTLILFYDSGGIQVGSTVVGGAATSSTSAWTESVASGVAPEGAVKAKVYATPQSALLDEVHYVDRQGLWEGTSTDWVSPVTLAGDLPTVQFDGNQYVGDTVTPFPAGALTQYVVTCVDSSRTAPYSMGLTSSSAGQVLYGFLTNPSQIASIARDSASTIMTPGSSVGAGIGVYRIASMVLDGPDVAIRVNGGAAVTANDAGMIDPTEAADRISIGSYTLAVSSQSLQGSVSAALVFSGAHDDATRQSIERAMGHIYGIEVA